MGALGVKIPNRVEVPIQDAVLGWQQTILSDLLSSLTLSRIADAEGKIAPEKDAFTTAELFERLTKSIFKELDDLKEGSYTVRKPGIPPMRRNLQRKYFDNLARLAMGDSLLLADLSARTPSICQSVATSELTDLQKRIKSVLDGKAELDPYTKAHLNELNTRIEKVLEARLELKKP